MPAIFKRTNRYIVCLCTILSILQISACSSSSEGAVDIETQSYVGGQNSNQGGPQGYNQTNGQGYNQTNGQGYNQTNGQGYNQTNGQGYNQTNGQGYNQTNGQSYGQNYTQINTKNGNQYQRNPSSALPPEERILLIKSKLLTWRTPVSREDSTPLLISEIASYRIYYGSQRKDYQEMIEVKTAASNRFDFSGFPQGIYYMVLTAVDTEGRESLYSRELMLINVG